jgi:23S rRNA (guanine745-N1)-methyltransferase
MTDEGTTLLACPACRDPLRRASGAYVCAHSHTFDIARSGYVNLLSGRKKLSPTVGDSKEMLAARQRFLDAGHYAPLTEALGNLLSRDGMGSKALVEVGSGTGHHIGTLSASLPPGTGYGFDVSKDAARMGARRYPGVLFAVADVKHFIPLVDDAAMALLDVFSPRNVEEFARVLDPDGSLIIALPTPEHLGELVSRFGLLTVPGDKLQDVVDEMEARFTLARRNPVSFEMSLAPKDALDAIAMGPSARHVDLDQIENGLREGCSVTASMMVLEFRKK